MASDTEDISRPTSADLSTTITKIAEQSHRLFKAFLDQQFKVQEIENDPLNIGFAFAKVAEVLTTHPAEFGKAQEDLWRDYINLWQQTAHRIIGNEVEVLAEPEVDDRRFSHPAWQENPIFDGIKQSYLLTSRWMIKTVKEMKGMDPITAQRAEFYTRQFVDAMAPTNFAFTNPEVIQETIASNGQNIVRGLSNFLDDLERGNGKLAIKHVEPEAFVIGKTVAATPGKVVFQNDLLQLLQFNPTTSVVRKTPLLIVPPWINKYYILDLREKNSFVKWAVEQGHTVFVISWVNPDEKLAHKTFEDYMLEGPIAAVGAACSAASTDRINIIGYCIGGTITAAALAHMAQEGDRRITSATFLTTLVDFEKPGDLGVFIDDKQIAGLEKKMTERGYLEGSEMATTFSMLRANDLIWSFVINNYLLGKEPFPFDLLFWNADSTRMPAAMHLYYLRMMYQCNALAKPGELELAGVKIDLRKIDIPVYILSAKEDHIAPWESTYKATQLYAGDNTFVLASSGHIAGVINPPVSNRYSYYTNTNNPETPEDWLTTAEEHPGSWWVHWDNWVKKYAYGDVAPRSPGDGPLKTIEDAPGSYVMVRAA